MIRRTIVSVALLLATPAVADNDPNRRTDLVAADLHIPEQTFIDCFMDVQPDGDKNPSGRRQKMNKAILLPCLQAANPSISNSMLDTVMDRHRPEGPIRK